MVRLTLTPKIFILALKFAVEAAIFEAAFLSPLNLFTICPHFCAVCLSMQQLIANAIAPTARSYKTFLISNLPVQNQLIGLLIDNSNWIRVWFIRVIIQITVV